MSLNKRIVDLDRSSIEWRFGDSVVRFRCGDVTGKTVGGYVGQTTVYPFIEFSWFKNWQYHRMDGPARICLWGDQGDIFSRSRECRDPDELDEILFGLSGDLHWYVDGVWVQGKQNTRIPSPFPVIDIEFILRNMMECPRDINDWLRVARCFGLLDHPALCAMELL